MIPLLDRGGRVFEPLDPTGEIQERIRQLSHVLLLKSRHLTQKSVRFEAGGS